MCLFHSETQMCSRVVDINVLYIHVRYFQCKDGIVVLA